MKIADNVKRGGVLPPPGSYSYQWIEFSIKNGQLENKDDYEIGPPLGTSRQIGSAQQTRTTRTTFTVKDDLILTQWVLSKEWKGQAASGNEMYKELELLVSRSRSAITAPLLISSSIRITHGSLGGTDGSGSSKTGRGLASRPSHSSLNSSRTPVAPGRLSRLRQRLRTTQKRATKHQHSASGHQLPAGPAQSVVTHRHLYQ